MEGVVNIFQGIVGELKGGELATLATGLEKAALDFINKLNDKKTEVDKLVKAVHDFAEELKAAKDKREAERKLRNAEDELQKFIDLFYGKY